MEECLICKKELQPKQQKFCSWKCKNKSQGGKKVKSDPTINIRCKIDGKTFADYLNRGGALTIYSRNILHKEFDWNDWERISVELKPTWNCPYCSWRSVDVENKSGWITSHLQKKHNLSPADHCKGFPDDKKLWQQYWIKKEALEFMDKSKDNRIQCLECGQWFKKITNRHLKDKHGMTNNEYKEKHNLQVLSSVATRDKMSECYYKNDRLLECNYTSKGQIEVGDYLNSLGIQFSIRRKDREELDIFVEDYNIAVEYNGLYWHSFHHAGKGRYYHLRKTQYCEENGIHLIHIYEDDWRDKQDIIKSRLCNLFNKNEKRIFARRCEIREVSNSDKNDFLNLNHIQGEDSSGIRYGLYHEDKLVSIMTFKSIKYQSLGNNVHELVRFCNKKYHTVIGGASKLLQYAEKNNDFRVLISYADRHWTTLNKTTIYDTLGFTFDGATDPDYWYMKGHTRRLDRRKFQKKMLLNKFPGYTNDMTEWEIMLDLGYDKIHGCGSLKYIKRYGPAR